MKRLLLALLLLFPLSAFAIDGAYNCTGNNILAVVTSPLTGQTQFGFIAGVKTPPNYGWGTGWFTPATGVFSGTTFTGQNFWLQSSGYTLSGAIDLINNGVLKHLTLTCYLS